MSQQDTRFASVTTPLGKDILLFNRMSGTEEMSRLFEYELDLLVENKNLGSIVTGGFPINKVLGEAMTVALELPSGKERYFHGLVTQFRHHGAVDDTFLYRAVLRPWLWFLTRTSNCRIFQEKSVPDIIKKVFEANGHSDFKMELTKTYSPRNYCVQYRESDFNFVSRLMECEGIFYFFKHEKNKHTLVIADSVSAYHTIGGYETIPYFPPENTGQRKQDHIFEWHTAHKVQSGAYVLNDYDFEKPKSDLVTTFTEKKSHSHAECEQYDYPGDYCEPPIGETYANIRLDELQTDHEVIQGKGNAMGLTSGMLFTLKDHYIAPENTKHIVISANFLIVSNQYRATSGEETHYECTFKAIRSTQQFRPQRLTPIPFVQGPQTATVVCKDGEEIWTDKYGRIKVQFHWERNGKKNESSSCWIRVSYPVAGKNWGWVSLPRKDQEVVVSFLEGNPDRPLITGSVYNANQMPPYALPANQTQSGIKSRSSKGGFDANFNEIRFEDKKGVEQVYIHAEKNQDIEVEHDETHSVGHDRTKTVDNNETVNIGKNRSETVGENETISIVKNRSEDVGVNETITIGKNRQETVGENETLEVSKNRELTVGDNETINIGKNHTIEVGDTRKTTIGKDDMNQVGKKYYLEAADEITLKTGDASITMKKDGTIQIKGGDITIVGSGKVGVKASSDLVLKGSKIAEN
jgi:type VI secretion system secreted protein VgrG